MYWRGVIHESRSALRIANDRRKMATKARAEERVSQFITPRGDSEALGSVAVWGAEKILVIVERLHCAATDLTAHGQHYVYYRVTSLTHELTRKLSVLHLVIVF